MHAVVTGLPSNICGKIIFELSRPIYRVFQNGRSSDLYQGTTSSRAVTLVPHNGFSR
jgi:hypothetical protein